MFDILLKIVLGLVALLIFVKFFRSTLHFSAAYFKRDDVVNFTVLLPRKDDAAERQKDTKKDFKETIGIMSQLFRSLHEMRELDFALYQYC